VRSVSWWSDVYGGSPGGGPYGDVWFNVNSCDPGGTWISVSYSVAYPIPAGYGWDDLGSVIVSTWSGWCLGPDIDVSYPGQ